MGKNKAQRTKNNAKPSNSSRSAELLGTSMPNFVGFSAVKDGGYVPVLPGLSISVLNEMEINTIDSNFQLVFKKMNKKDATTKFKALQEFADMCKDSPLSSVEAVLPFWPRHYCALAIDLEHRVREAAQIAHAAVVKRVGRSIATYLKQLAGPWFTSQFDTYPLAASAATNSFQETFPQKKIIDAIIHCQDEILTYISDNIINQSPQSMCTNKSFTPEELETKYQRMLISSLQGYSQYLRKVPNQQIEKTITIHRKIICSGKFWKFAKHETLLIKTAFFNVLASIIDNASYLLKDEKKRAMTAIMNSLDETEPGILSAVWECMLVAIDKIEDWHLVVSMEKLVLPKLWRVLRSGGQGCASVVYPSLLPFISQFPKLSIDNKKNTFINFFENMRQGFGQKTVQMSRSEMFAITKAFTECLRYAILMNNEDLDLCEILLKEHLIPVLETSVKDYSPTKAILFSEVTQLIRYWSKNRESAEYQSYSVLVKIFWIELEAMFQRLINYTSEIFDNFIISSIQNAEIKLLLNLKSAPMINRKNYHVKFADSDDQPSKEQEPMKIPAIESDEKFLDELDQFITKLCITYLKNIGKNDSTKSIKHLNRLVTNFESKDLFIAIAKAYRDDDNLLEFYNDSLRHWLKEKTTETDIVVQFIFTLLKYMNDESKEMVLDSLSKLEDKKILNNTVASALAKNNRKDKKIRNWLIRPHVTEHLIDIAKRIIDNENDNNNNKDSDRKLLLLSFESSDGEINVSQNAIDGIAEILCEASNRPDQSPSDYIVELISQLLELTWAHQEWANGSLQLLRTLFELSIHDTPTSDIKKTIRENWKFGFARVQEKLPYNQLFEVQKDCLKIIFDKLYSSCETNIEDIVDIGLDFVEASCNYDYHDALSVTIKFNLLQKILYEEWIPQLTDLILYGEIVSGNFHLANPIRSLPLDRPMTFIVSDIEKIPNKAEYCLKWALFTAKLLNKLLVKLDEDDLNDEIDSGIKDCLADLPHILNSILLIVSLGDLYGNYYKSAKNYNTIKEIHDSLVFGCVELRNRVPKYIWGTVLTESVSVDSFWVEFGSIFNQFLRHFYLNNNHVSEVKNDGGDVIKKYLISEESSLTLVHHINAVALARNLISDGRHDFLCTEVLVKMIKRHQEQNFLLFNGEIGIDIGNVTWEDFYLPLEIIRLLTKFIESIPTKMDSTLWDAAIVYLASWQFTMNKSKHHHDDLKVRCFIVAVSQLFCAIQSLMNKHESQKINGLPSSLLSEWKDVFFEDVHRGIATTWMFYADLFNDKSEYLMPTIVLNNLGNAVKLIDGNIFFNLYNGNSSLTITSNQLMKFSLKLMSSSVPSLQLSSYYMLRHMIPKLVEQDKDLIEKETFDAKSLNIYKFEDCLRSTQKIVNAMLMDFKLCDTTSCTIQPFTDSYTYTLAYLLVWENILTICAHAHADLRYQYAEILKDEFFPSLMNNIFRLMPVEVLQENNSRIPAAQAVEIFKNPPLLSFDQSPIDLRLDHIVCWVYINCLRYLPVSARQWWGTTEGRVTSAVEKITTLYVSPILCQEELLNKRLKDVANMQVKVHPSARELVALYHMDDVKLELSMVLPTNHPLGQVTVEPGQHAGGAANWRNCHMQLSIFLTHQNCSIWDGLMMWKKNLDKKFSGVEECYICFSIFHINTYQIPKLSCHTCRKKFHAPCLYKWFSTSQKSSCPICRNTF